MSWRLLATKLLQCGSKCGRRSTLRYGRRHRASMASPLPVEHEELHGFRVMGVHDIEELAATAVHLSHVTGVQYLHVARDDANNTFGVGFRTPPANSTGVAHILEHTTLCGSQLYPTRDPFFKMLNRSLATFMNAFTASDWTMYPFSTCNATDFANLLQVYLDAVFCPRLEHLDFLQEGWRLEHSDPHDRQSPIIFKGVVFNEMKGALADRHRYFAEKIQNGLLPSHAYGHCSGGEPLHIPELSCQQLRDFHAHHYHPHNCYMYSYGDMSLHSHLALINDGYLHRLGVNEHSKQTGVPASLIPLERRWTSASKQSVTCRPDPLVAHADRQDSVAVSYLLADVTDEHETFVLQLISQLLLDGPSAPFYGTLIESGLGLDFTPHCSGLDNSVRETSFTVGLQGVRPADQTAVIEAIDRTLAQTADTGFEAERVEAVIHQIELGLKHQSNSFGLSLLMHALTPWIHGADPVSALRINSIVEEFRRRWTADPQLLQRKLRHYLCDNQHRLVSTMTPTADHEQQASRRENELLEQRVSQLDESQRLEIYETGLKLLEKQQQGDLGAECLPLLAVSDIADSCVRYDPAEIRRVNDVPVHLNIQPTNDVCYFRAVLNVADVPAYFKPLLPLFCQLLTAMGTQSTDYRQLDRRIQLYTGGLSANVMVTDCPETRGRHHETVLLKSHCLHRNVAHMFDIWRELFAKVSFDDVARLRALLQMAAAEAANGVTAAGHQYAMAEAASSLTAASRLRNVYGGLEQLRYIRSVAESGGDGGDLSLLSTKLRMLAEMVLSRGGGSGGGVRCAINTTSSTMSAALDGVTALVSEMHAPAPAEGSPDNAGVQSECEAVTRRQYVQLPLPVGFVALALPTVPYSHEDYAPLRVLSRHLSLKHLHREVREKGGAYGGGSMAAGGAVWSYFSYRDPRPLDSLRVFSSAADHIRQHPPNSADVHGAQLGVFQSVDAPIVPGDRGMRQFLSGISDDMFAEHRQRLKAVSADDLQRVSARYLQEPVVTGTCVIGPAVDNLDSDWSISQG